ncbi:hypothetical protein [Paenibacillus chitinolyticus]|uniref:hypothetical protein n=1 Tax=Paenibacillus chitinolyticus TaxID=79263 RepID=UPI0036718AA3
MRSGSIGAGDSGKIGQNPDARDEMIHRVFRTFPQVPAGSRLSRSQAPKKPVSASLSGHRLSYEVGIAESSEIRL